MRIAVTGATGFIGRRLCELAKAAGHELITLSRSGRGQRPWDPLREAAPLEGAEAVVHLAGEPLVPGRWTRRKMERIRASRVEGTRNLVAGIRAARPHVLVCASAIGYYGDRGEEALTELSTPGTDFLANVCVEWEAEADRSGIRTVLMRTATVVGPGGALERMMAPFSMGLGGKLGNGRHWMSWIHRDDLAALYLRAVEDATLWGPVVASAPEAVRSEEFTRALGQVLERPTFFRIPRLGMRLAFGKVASVLFASQKCIPRRALELGFEFRYPNLPSALREAIESLRTTKAA